MRHGLGALEREGDLYRGTEADSLGAQASSNATLRTAKAKYSTETGPASVDAFLIISPPQRVNFIVLTAYQPSLIYRFDFGPHMFEQESNSKQFWRQIVT
jgi:hypothetical protein